MTSLATRDSAALANTGPRTLAQRLNYDPDQLDFVRRVIADGAPDPELEYFIRFCSAHGLDPTAREAYYIKRNANKQVNGQWQAVPTWTIQVGIDGYRGMAETSGMYDGQDEATFEYEADGKTLKSATVKVYKKGIKRPFVGTARWSEYVQLKDNRPNSMWSKMGHNQLAKCAEALALRKAFPRKLGGIYTREEMAQAENPPIDVTSTARELPAAGSRAAQLGAALDEQVYEGPKPVVPDLTNKTAIEIRDIIDDEAQARGIDPKVVRDIIKEVAGGRLVPSTAPAVLAKIFETPLLDLAPTE